MAGDGTLWAGGSIQTSVREGGSNQFSGGFARFAARPSRAPAAPTAPAVSLQGATATVSWSPSSSTGVRYEVLRGDRVVAVSWTTSVRVPDSGPDDRFFVRASDGQGNWSASTRVVRAVRS